MRRDIKLVRLRDGKRTSWLLQSEDADQPAALTSSDSFELGADMLDIVLAGRRRFHHGDRHLLRNAGELTFFAISEADIKPPVIRAEID